MEAANGRQKRTRGAILPESGCYLLLLLVLLLLLGFEFHVIADVNVFQSEGNHSR